LKHRSRDDSAGVGAALIMSALLVARCGCQKQEGPAEQAGEEVGQATGKVGEQIEKLETASRTR